MTSSRHIRLAARLCLWTSSQSWFSSVIQYSHGRPSGNIRCTSYLGFQRLSAWWCKWCSFHIGWGGCPWIGSSSWSAGSSSRRILRRYTIDIQNCLSSSGSQPRWTSILNCSSEGDSGWWFWRFLCWWPGPWSLWLRSRHSWQIGHWWALSRYWQPRWSTCSIATDFQFSNRSTSRSSPACPWQSSSYSEWPSDISDLCAHRWSEYRDKSRPHDFHVCWLPTRKCCL